MLKSIRRGIAENMKYAEIQEEIKALQRDKPDSFTFWRLFFVPCNFFCVFRVFGSYNLWISIIAGPDSKFDREIELRSPWSGGKEAGQSNIKKLRFLADGRWMGREERSMREERRKANRPQRPDRRGSRSLSNQRRFWSLAVERHRGAFPKDQD